MELIRKEIEVDGKKTNYDNIHYAAIRYFGKQFHGGKYMEIGTSYGHSAYQAWTAMHPSRMVLVDLFEEKRQMAFVVRTLVVIGCTADLSIHEGNSHRILKDINENFDLILVDGDHKPNGAWKDLVWAWEHLNEEGVIIFDDIDIKPLQEVSRAFKDEVNPYRYYESIEWKHGISAFKK